MSSKAAAAEVTLSLDDFHGGPQVMEILAERIREAKVTVVVAKAMTGNAELRIHGWLEEHGAVSVEFRKTR